MVLHHQLLFNLAIAKAILMKTSAEQVPLLHWAAPRYLELVICSNFWLFMLISALAMFMLLFIILLFSVLTSIPHAVALSVSVGEVLKFTAAVAHKIKVICKW